MIINKSRALIFGITGQDGAYLANFLLKKGYEVFGTTRNLANINTSNLIYLDIHNSVYLMEVETENVNSISTVLQSVNPTEIYNLSGMSSVALSFLYPEEAYKTITIATSNLLEAIRKFNPSIKFFNACSSECFGDTNNTVADELTPFKPLSPYAVAKAATYWQLADYRSSYGLYACSGILFNHESPLRAETFVTKKIISGALAIARGELSHIELGNIDMIRDWGYAPDYVEAMWRMLQLDEPVDLVIATGKGTALKEFLCLVFNQLSLDWERCVRINNSFIRPLDITFSVGNPSKALLFLNWKSSTSINDIVSIMLNSARLENEKAVS